MSQPPASVARRVYRRGLALLPSSAQISAKRAMLSMRRRVRHAVRRSRGLGIIDVPGGQAGHAPVLVAALGVDDAGLAVAAAHAVTLRGRGWPALVLTDCDAFGELRRHDLPFEYVPPPEDHARVLTGDYAAFLERRARAIRATWRPGTVVDVGERPLPHALARLVRQGRPPGDTGDDRGLGCRQ